MPFRVEGRRVATPTTGTSMTKQDPEMETNINRIVEKHRRTGSITHLSRRQATYGDFSFVSDLQGALDLVSAVQDDFEALNGKIRKAAKNSPLEWARMLATEEGVKALQAAGMDFGPSPNPPETPETGEAPPQDTPGAQGPPEP